MAITYPANCKGITAGALRQVKQHGYSTAGGGVVSNDRARELVAKADWFFTRGEPGGIFMEALEKTKLQLGENTDAIRAAGTKLVETATDANKKMADVTGKFRDGTERLGTAIDKLMKIAGRGDFAETVKLAESLADSLERLAVLEEKGLLDKVMRAMRG